MLIVNMRLYIDIYIKYGIQDVVLYGLRSRDVVVLYEVCSRDVVVLYGLDCVLVTLTYFTVCVLVTLDVNDDNDDNLPYFKLTSGLPLNLIKCIIVMKC